MCRTQLEPEIVVVPAPFVDFWDGRAVIRMQRGPNKDQHTYHKTTCHEDKASRNHQITRIAFWEGLFQQGARGGYAEERLSGYLLGVKYSPPSRHYSEVFKIESSLPLTFRPAIFYLGSCL